MKVPEETTSGSRRKLSGENIREVTNETRTGAYFVDVQLFPKPDAASDPVENRETIEIRVSDAGHKEAG